MLKENDQNKMREKTEHGGTYQKLPCPNTDCDLYKNTDMIPK